MTDINIKHAKECSRNGYGKFRLGAAIYDKKGKLISKGYNKRKTHPKFGAGYYTRLHAEGDALLKALKSNEDIVGGYCVVYRNKGNLAKPCKCCESMLRESGISEVYYTYGNKDNLKYMEL